MSTVPVQPAAPRQGAFRRGHDGGATHVCRKDTVERILREHGYPPDEQEQARAVLEQGELLSTAWAVA